MWEALKNLSGKAKAGIIGGVVLLAAAGVGIGVWQPWNQPEETPDEPEDQQQVQTPGPQEQPEKGLSLRVEGKDIPCILYEGTGWSIYVPEDWDTEKQGENGGLFSSEDGAQLSVRFEPGSDHMGNYVNLSAGEGGRTLQFYSGTGEGSPVVEGSAPKAKWDQYDRLFVAMARTLEVGDGKPFAETYVIPDEPDWQKADGLTVLFLDKDGYVIDSDAQEAVERYMQDWPEADRANYTGQYRINSLEWVSSYTGVTQNGYIDVFRANVQYRVKDGAAPEGASVVNGWASLDDSVYLAVFHDGGAVGKTQSVVTSLENGWIGFVSEIA